MQTQLKDVIHLYKGCTMRCIKGEQSLLREYSIHQGQEFTLSAHRMFVVSMMPDYFKPILRPLGSMTEEERTEFHSLNTIHDNKEKCEANNTVWLFSRSFDLFGLIESNQAMTKEG
jgi:hypothetical protein